MLFTQEMIIQVDENLWILFGKSCDKRVKVENMFLIFYGLWFKRVYEGNIFKSNTSLWKHGWIEYLKQMYASQSQLKVMEHNF